jgi:hypothetical protein
MQLLSGVRNFPARGCSLNGGALPASHSRRTEAIAVFQPDRARSDQAANRSGINAGLNGGRSVARCRAVGDTRQVTTHFRLFAAAKSAENRGRDAGMPVAIWAVMLLSPKSKGSAPQSLEHKSPEAKSTARGIVSGRREQRTSLKEPVPARPNAASRRPHPGTVSRNCRVRLDSDQLIGLRKRGVPCRPPQLPRVLPEGRLCPHPASCRIFVVSREQTAPKTRERK